MKQSAHRILSRFHLPSWGRGECCIFKPDALGDLILATGAIQQLNRHFGAGNCTLITSKANHECAEYLFPHNPKINTGHSFGGRQHGEPLSSLFRVMPRLSRARFNTLVCLRHQRLPLHQAMLLTWIKAHRQFGVNSPQAPSWDRFREADISYPGPGTQRNGACLELEAHAAVLSQCTGVQFTGADLKPTLETMPGEGYLLFNPYGSEEKKQCPIPRWVEIVDAIERDIPGQICRVSCPPGKLLEARATFKNRVMPTASFREYYESVARARAVVTIDTATAHLGIAMDKPSVVLIGGAQFGMFGPWKTSERQRWIHHDLPCYQCHWHCSQPEATCLTAIHPKQVISSVKALLADAGQGK